MNNVLFDILMSKAEEYYRHMEKSKFYHNYEHALFVVEMVKKLTTSPSHALLLAAMYHDAVYIPKAGSDANERCSAALLENIYDKYRRLELRDHEVNENIINHATDLIRNTHVTNHLSSIRLEGDLAILLDADLSSLAVDYLSFRTNQNRIIIENYGIVERDNQKSKEFLKQFLTCREFIYHTDKAREIFESQARKNIQQYIGD